MLGLGNTAIAMGRVVGPIWAGYAFDLNLSYPYLSGAVVLLSGFVAAVAGLSNRRESQIAGVSQG